jgi:hypothetical protein
MYVVRTYESMPAPEKMTAASLESLGPGKSSVVVTGSEAPGETANTYAFERALEGCPKHPAYMCSYGALVCNYLFLTI